MSCIKTLKWSTQGFHLSGCKQPFLKGIAIFIGISESTVALGEESGEGRREPPRGDSKQAKLKKSGVTRSVLNIFFSFS